MTSFPNDPSLPPPVESLAEAETHFGFDRVATAQKASRVGAIFSSVAGRYDLMNDLMSGGLHRYWKHVLLQQIEHTRGKLLDVAGGTGDVALRYHARALAERHTPDITLCDINQAMLSEGRKRALNQNRFHGMRFMCGNAEALPFPDCSFDYYTIAFGIRNVTHISLALKEAYRVLKPGGKFLCLEFSHISLPWLATLYDTYSFRVIPLLGRWMTGNQEAYQYLVESIRMFPKQKEFQSMIEAAQFRHASYKNLTGGVVAIHAGWRI